MHQIVSFVSDLETNWEKKYKKIGWREKTIQGNYYETIKLSHPYERKQNQNVNVLTNELSIYHLGCFW